MDLDYVFFNTLIYGTLATVIAACMAYGKFLNLATAGYFIIACYIVYHYYTYGIDGKLIFLIIFLLAVYFGIHYLLLRLFPHEKQRDLAAIVITLAIAYCIENVLSLLYGPGSINIPNRGPSTVLLVILVVALVVLLYYLFSRSAIGIVLKAIHEKNFVVQSLGIGTIPLLQKVFGFFLIILFGIGYIFLVQSALKPSDGTFFLLKGIGIMILVGIGKKEYMFLGALLYVLIEYLLFIQFGLPIMYKETLVLLVILVILIYKPEGLFSSKKRVV